MSNYLTKATHNINAANQLCNGNTYFTPVVHCTYYACIQMMIHSILDYNKINEDQLKANSTQGGGGSHLYYINEVKKILAARKEMASLKKFTTLIYDLKETREESDYSNIIIDPKTARKALDNCLEVKSMFVTKFGYKIS